MRHHAKSIQTYCDSASRSDYDPSPQVLRLLNEMTPTPNFLSPNQQHHRRSRQHKRRKSQHRTRPLEPQHIVHPSTRQRQPSRKHIFPERETADRRPSEEGVCISHVLCRSCNDDLHAEPNERDPDGG